MTGRCDVVKVYIPTSEMDVAGITTTEVDPAMEVFCESMILNDQWEQKGLVAPDDLPAEVGDNWWSCTFSKVGAYTWRDGKCLRRKRYVGEQCWDGWWSGDCESETSDLNYKVSCIRGKCTPYSSQIEREQCTCSTGLPIYVICWASDGTCGGHACVLNTGNGNHYCDYGTDQGWTFGLL